MAGRVAFKLAAYFTMDMDINMWAGGAFYLDGVSAPQILSHELIIL